MKINERKTWQRADRIRAFAEKLFFFSAAVLFAAVGLYGQSVTVPNPSLTPGKYLPLTKTQACTTKWGKDERHVTPKMKKDVCLAYGITSGCPGKAWEIDHRGPRELAGADDERNLWPQPIAEARHKDRVETYLHKEVCAGRLTLEDAQQMILGDWETIYERIKAKR